jgi:sensor histidine kinase YesM
MRKINRWFEWNRYAKIETGFFLFVSIIVPLLSDLEYSLKEAPTELAGNFYRVNIIRRLVWGIHHIIPFYLFYKLAIQQLLIKKRYAWFLLSCIVFILFLEWYTVYVEYGTISKSTFLPPEIVAEATKWMHTKQLLHFTVSYLVVQLIEPVALGYYIHYDQQEKQLQELKRIQAENDLQQLKAQLQPHFFFNTLNNIYSLALQRSALTAPLVARLSDMMRYVLYDTENLKVPLEKETIFLANYVAVQSVRYHKNITINFDTQGIESLTMIAPLLLLPFVENAFKHGVEEEAGSGFIEIIICLAKDELTLSVSNSKPIKTKTDDVAAGIGIANTEKRLQLLYPGKYTLDIRQDASTHSVILSLNLN